jgi:hypothetical protein
MPAYLIISLRLSYGLDGPRIETRDFPRPSRSTPGPTHPSTLWVPGHSRGYNGGGVALTSHTHQAPRLKTELYLYSLSGSSWPVQGWTSHLPLDLYLLLMSYSTTLSQQKLRCKELWDGWWITDLKLSEPINYTTMVFVWISKRQGEKPKLSRRYLDQDSKQEPPE